jgi:hypothetical protein
MRGTWTWVWIAMALGWLVTGCAGQLNVNDDDDATGPSDDDDDSEADDDDSEADDDDAVGDDDDAVGDDDDAVGDDDDIDPDLLCGPEPDLFAGPVPYVVYTGYADVEVNANWQDHWYWEGCRGGYVVETPGELSCGVYWDMEGGSSSEHPESSSYEMDLQFDVVTDTCGVSMQHEMAQYRIQDVSGSWDLFQVEYYEPFFVSWFLLDPAAHGILNWDGNGTSGQGWIEFHSVPIDYQP